MWLGLLLLALAFSGSKPAAKGPVPGGNPNKPPAIDVPPYNPAKPMGNGKAATLTFETETTWTESEAPWGCQWVKVPGVAYAFAGPMVRIEVSVWVIGQWSRDGGDSFSEAPQGGTLVAVVPVQGGTIALPKATSGSCGGSGLSFKPVVGLRISPRVGGGFEVWIRAQGWKSAEVAMLAKVGAP